MRSKALEDPLNFPIKLNNKLASLSGAVASADTAPTRAGAGRLDDLANLRSPSISSPSRPSSKRMSRSSIRSSAN